MGKTIKGSAIVAEDGGFLFTPYNSAPENSPWQLVAAVAYGQIRRTEKKTSLRITFDSGQNPLETQSKMMRVFASLMSEYQKKTR